MKKSTSSISKVCIVAMLLAVPVTVVALSTQPHKTMEKEMESIDIKPNLNEVYFVDIPDGKVYAGYEIIDRQETKIKTSDIPKQCFKPTDEIVDEPIEEERVYDEPYSLDILKKGDKEVVRVFVPKTYYDGTYEIDNTDIEIKIYFEDEPITFKPSYEPQNPDYEYVIVTNESFWELLHNYYKDWKIANDNKINNMLIVNVSTILNQSNVSINGTWGDGTNTTGGNPWIADGKEVISNWEMFNDSQAKIRNYLRYCYTIHGTRYVLLFGNKDVVPPRMVCSYAAGTCPGCTDFYNDTSHASDMYYSCLHYNMNNNTNAYWMENAVCGSPVDEIDWGYDLRVGRILVNQGWETFWWINKTKNYASGGQSNYTKWNVVPCKNNGNAISNQTWSGWTGSAPGPGIGEEFPYNMSFINNQNISQAQWSILDDYANGNAGGLNGFVMIYHAGHGGTLWDPYSDDNLNNMDIPNFVISEGCTSADFGTDISSRMENWMSDDGAAFGGISNSAYGWFVASTYYGKQMMKEMFNDSNTSIFCEALDNAKEVVGHDPDCVWGQIVKSTSFFGDPAQEWVWFGGEVDSTNISRPNALRFDSGDNKIRPNIGEQSYQDVNEPLEDGDASYMYYDDNDGWGSDWFWFENKTGFDDIDSVTVTFYAKVNDTNNNDCWVSPVLTYAANGTPLTTGYSVFIDYNDTVNYTQYSHTWHTTNFGPWTQELFNNSFVGLWIYNKNGSYETRVTQLYFTINQESTTPQFISISNGTNQTTVYSENIVFNWTKINNASIYQLQIASDSGFASIVANIQNISVIDYPLYYSSDSENISFTLPPEYQLQLYDSYYCRVRAYVKD